jgi:DNA-binding GntR family transcriptional regulator
MANTSRETVTRAIRALIHSKVLEKDQRRLIVVNPEKLRIAAGGEAARAIPEKAGGPPCAEADES